MSLQFSDTINNRGVVELIDANCKTNSTSYPLIDKVRDVNLALDNVLSIILKSAGTWQFDDSNQTNYPIIETDVNAGQRDYSFINDNSGNLILDIYKVFLKDSVSGIYNEIKPVDVNSELNTESFSDGQNIQGKPYRYDKMANGIFLDPVPNATVENGLKMYINRETTYFTTADTTKKAGFAGIYHEYLAIRPSYMFAYRNNLANLVPLREEMLKMEKEIERYYGQREKDKKKILKASHLRYKNYI